jgi:probable addiction module antidote protein
MTDTRERFARYAVVDYLRSKQDIAAYLDACIEDAADGASCFAAALGDVARMRGTERIATETGISREQLDKTLSSDGNPSLQTVLKVMKALGLRFTTKVA